jgi:hypothetical protein
VNGFKKEKLSDWEIKSLKEKYSFKGKGFWTAIGILLLIVVMGSFIFPFLPRRYGGRWNPPTNQQEYNDRLTTNLILLPSLIILLIAFVFLRTYVDFRLGYKKTGEFTVTKIINLVSTKILVLDNWRIFNISKNEEYFKKVKEGQQIQIKRTGTHQLIDIYIYDKKANN